MIAFNMSRIPKTANILCVCAGIHLSGKRVHSFHQILKKTNDSQRAYLYYTVGHAMAYKLNSERATTERWEVWANKSSLTSLIQLEQL